MPAGLGKVDWKLSEYDSTVTNAYLSTNDKVEIIGPSFYTTGIGYKFGTAFQFDGLRIKVMVYPVKGVYDDSLEWPFAGNITVSLPSIRVSYG